MEKDQEFVELVVKAIVSHPEDVKTAFGKLADMKISEFIKKIEDHKYHSKRPQKDGSHKKYLLDKNELEFYQQIVDIFQQIPRYKFIDYQKINFL